VTEGQPAHQPMSRKEIAPILVGLMVAMFPGALDTTIMGPAMPTIGRELGDQANLPWIVTSYLLVSTAATPLYGKLSDIHGRRIMLQVAIAIFAVGSIFCALAPTMILLALARALQAVGGGGLVSIAMTVVGDIVPPRDRPRYQIYTSVMWTLSSLLGPILGGYFAERWHWSLIFWINLPLCLAAFLMTDRKLKSLPRHERPHKLDFIGAGLLVAASVLLQLLLSWGGTRYAWTSSTILLLGAASIGFTALLIWRLNSAAEPLIPYSLMRNQIVLVGSSAVGITMAVFVGLMIYVPIYFESIRGISATYSGLSLLPLTICTTIGAVAAGRGMTLLEHYKIVPLIGLLIAAAALMPMFVWPQDLSILMVEILLGIVATGVGAVFPVTTVSVQNSVGRHELGTATSLITFLRNLGAAAGVAIFGTIAISGTGVAPELVQGHVLLAPDLVDRFRWIFCVGAIGFLIAFLTLLMMEERPLAVRQQTRAYK
jgi:EmrB/QacA subfamily drug resistance transporter